MTTQDLLLSSRETRYEPVRVSGIRENMGTSYELISTNGDYPCPAPSDAQLLRIAAGGNVNDTVTGSGARTVLLIGLDVNLKVISEELTTNGASASAFTEQTFLRLSTAVVVGSGTRGTSAVDSHAGTITIEDVNLLRWSTILFADGVAQCVSQNTCYTVPATLANGDEIKELYLMEYLITVDTGKTVDILISTTSGILNETAPFAPVIVVRRHLGFDAPLDIKPRVPTGPFMPGTDVLMQARGQSTPDVGMFIEYALVKKSV